MRGEKAAIQTDIYDLHRETNGMHGIDVQNSMLFSEG